MESPRRQRVDALVRAERSRLSQQDGVDDVLARLREDGVIPNDAILVIEDLFGLTFNAAKDALASSPAYSSRAKQSKPFQDAAEEALRQLADE
jgi:hypothetical protein